MPYKQFTPVTLTASDVNTYLMNQSVITFANAAARTTALPLPTEGMVTYLQDTKELEIYNGTTWLRLVVTAEDDAVAISQNLLVGQGQTTMLVDAVNHKVGVGTSSPDVFMHVKNFGSGISTNGYTTHLRVENGGDTGVSLHTSSNFSAVVSHATTLDNASGALIFDGQNRAVKLAAVNGIVRLSVNGNAGGSVSMPYQPYFNGQLSGGNQVFNGAWSPGTVHINNGSRFNTGNGRFTAGVAGAYVLCSFNSLINTPQTDSHAYVWFQVDGVEKSVRTHTDYNHSRSYEPLSNTAVVYLPTASSYVECQVRCVNNGSLYGAPWGGGLTFAMLG